MAAPLCRVKRVLVQLGLYSLLRWVKLLRLQSLAGCAMVAAPKSTPVQTPAGQLPYKEPRTGTAFALHGAQGWSAVWLAARAKELGCTEKALLRGGQQMPCLSQTESRLPDIPMWVTVHKQAGHRLACRHPLRSRSRHQLLCSCLHRSGSRPGFWSAAQSAPYLQHRDRC